MQLIDKNGLPIDDLWSYPGDGDELTNTSQSIVRLAQWEAYRAAFGVPAAGIWVEGDQNIAEIEPFLAQLKVIVIEFPKTRDGRGFTLARLLRERHSYRADLRASGPLLPDQFGMLLECGYSSFLVSAAVPLERWLEAAQAQAQYLARPRTLLGRISQNRQV